jgi:TonB family protein
MSVAKAFSAGTASPAAEGGDRRLARFALIAFALEATTLVVVGTYQHWMVHPKKADDSARFVEAEMVQLPKEIPVLQEEKPVAPPKAPEPVLSKVPTQGRQAKDDEKKAMEDQKNQTASPHTQLGPTHGPVAVFSPSPAIPSYMQDKDLRANVVIDFYITALGAVTPRLVGSSGNEELDAIAIGTAKKWQFRPAEKDHQAIDSKVRLRILFDVH